MNSDLIFKIVEEQISSKQAEKCTTVAQALRDLGGFAETTKELVTTYKELAGVSPSTAKRHIKSSVDTGFINRMSTTTSDGQQAYEYKLPDV